MPGIDRMARLGEDDAALTRYESTLESLRRHQTPAWYHDAKLGIFIHWGPFSVPAYAPLGHGDIQQILSNEGYRSFFRNIPYSEWYVNSIRIEGSPANLHHQQTYGHDVSYFDFAAQFKRESEGWQPGPWAELFRAAGARYVVLVTKHMDGFLMWPSEAPNYMRSGYQMDRDIVGELNEAVTSLGMRMGVYYSSALDQSFTTSAMADLVGLASEGGPLDDRYARYQFGHWRELIDRYHPSVLWGDIAYPPRTSLFELFAYFYNAVPDGVVNDRWGQLPAWLHRVIRTRPGRALLNAFATRLLRQSASGGIRPRHADFRTPEFTVMSGIRAEKWETCRGMGHGFGFNRQERDEDHIQLPDLIRTFVDIVSKNGNLLLNVGPMADGTIPEAQVRLLRGLGEWLTTYGEAIYGTRPWQRAEGTTATGGAVRFTRRPSTAGDTIYAIFMDPLPGGPVTIRDLQVTGHTTVRDIATGTPIEWRRDREDLVLHLDDSPPGVAAHAVAISTPLG